MEDKIELVKYDDPILQKRCYGITEITPKLFTVAKEMIKLMYAKDGVGLAAPQVGLPIRLFVMHMFDEGSEKLEKGKEIDSGKAVILVNPKIVSGEGKATNTEGCLSFPNLTLPIERYAKVKMSSALLSTGEYQTLELTGLNAIIAQHEIDHLDGITFLDKLKHRKRRALLKKYEQIISNDV